MTAFGTVTSYDTGTPVRPATAAEWRRTAGRLSEPGDGYTGAWQDSDGHAVYVDGGPDAGVSAQDIADLGDEAGAAGDLEQVRICRLAAGDDPAAWDACREVILDARMHAAEDDLDSI